MISDPTTHDRRTIASWSLYDFANSAFTTLIVTFIYATYFTRAIAPDEITGTDMWSIAVTVTALMVALLSPYVGAIADRGGYRKRFLLISTVVCIGGTVVLFFPQAGEAVFALSCFVVANIAFEMANVFYNAYLPDLAPEGKIGRISGYGWAMGYVGGLICLVIALYGFVDTETPLFGLSTENGENIRATNLLVAVWFAVFSIPMFAFVHDKKPPNAREKDPHIIRSANRQIGQTFKEIRKYRQVFRLLVARLIYNDGLITVFAFGGIYAQGTFGFETADVIVFGIGLNVSAGLGAYFFGFLDDKLGGKRTIMVSLVGLFLATLLAVITTSITLFWVAGILIGLLAGPNQSASRSLLGRFVPPNMENEFFGFFAFSGKATAFLGPFLLGRLTSFFGTQRAGVATILIFFVIGAVLLLSVDEEEGVAAANRPAAPPT